MEAVEALARLVVHAMEALAGVPAQARGALTQLLNHAPDDPLLLAGIVVAAWLPLCAIGLLALAAVAAGQSQAWRRRAPRPVLVTPPAEVRPLATRRLLAGRARAANVLGIARLGLAIGAVLAFTAATLLAGSSLLLAGPWR